MTQTEIFTALTDIELIKLDRALKSAWINFNHEAGQGYGTTVHQRSCSYATNEMGNLRNDLSLERDARWRANR